MGHVVLLGDSIFDNAAYIAGGPDVRAQLQACLPPGWRATRLAVGGSRTPEVLAQLRQLPPDASHLVLSVGGNDALDHLDFLSAPAQSVAEALDGLAAMAEAFEGAYHRLVQAALQHALPTTLCTIYYPCFPLPGVRRRAVTALAVFNDVIIREAFTAGVALCDLRLICTAEVDYANPIEPSVVGGGKIAAAIARAVREPAGPGGRPPIFI